MAWPQGLSAIYPQEKLAGERQRLEARVGEFWSRAIFANLTAAEKRALAGVQFQFPLVGINGGPLDFYADSQKRTVFMPILSLLFLEDLSTAYAWLWANGYSLETIDEYVSMLKY